MRLGLLAYSSDTGLGNQSWEIFKHLKPSKTLLIDLSRFNNMPTHHERYPEARITNGLPNDNDIEWITNEVDAIIFCETPLNYRLISRANEKGILTFDQFNFEFFDYFRQPELPKPSFLIPPTNWNINKIERLNIAPINIMQVPTNQRILPKRSITRCETFIHSIGRPAIYDRNGTIAFLLAAKRLPKTCKFKIYLQPPTDQRAIEYFRPVERLINELKSEIDLEIIKNTPRYQDIYLSGDVLVMPRKYGGLCMPANEAIACGIPTIMTDISPNEWLPKEWLCEAELERKFIAHTEIEVFSANVQSLYYKMEQFLNKDFMIEAHHKALSLGQDISWDIWTQRYLDFINAMLCKKQ